MQNEPDVEDNLQLQNSFLGILLQMYHVRLNYQVFQSQYNLEKTSYKISSD